MLNEEITIWWSYLFWIRMWMLMFSHNKTLIAHSNNSLLFHVTRELDCWERDKAPYGWIQSTVLLHIYLCDMIISVLWQPFGTRWQISQGSLPNIPLFQETVKTLVLKTVRNFQPLHKQICFSNLLFCKYFDLQNFGHLSGNYYKLHITVRECVK